MNNPPEKSWTVRATRPDDAEGVAALANLPGYRYGTMRLPFSTPEATRRWIESANEANTNIVAEWDGQIVGNAGLTRFAGRRAHCGSIGLGVHDDFTGRGIGKSLLAALIETADDWLGLRRLELTVYCDNATGIALYERLGFVIEGRLIGFGFRQGQYVDAFTMARLSPRLT